jgi:galactose mutarotase-like enzyme
VLRKDKNQDSVDEILNVFEKKKRQEGGCASPDASSQWISAQEDMAISMHFPLPSEHVLTSGNTTIGIIPELSLVSHFQVGSWQVLYRPIETGNIERWGIPLMIPNFSRLKYGIFEEKGTTLPIHGFGRSFPWTVVEQDSSHMSIQLLSNSATRLNYPYDFTFTATIAASEETLTYTLTIENRSDEAMPIAPGFHPYFAVAQRDKAKLVVDSPPGFEVDAFDWDTSPPDNPYPFPHRVSLQFPDRGTLTIEERPGDAQYMLANMQVWTEPVSTPDHEFVCFEPTVSSEDALNRPADRLNLAPCSSHQIVLQLMATPL